jgi:hypothetical protein
VTSATATSTIWSISILIIPFHVPFLDDAPMTLSSGECTSVLLSARNEQTAQNHMQISWTCLDLNCSYSRAPKCWTEEEECVTAV